MDGLGSDARMVCVRDHDGNVLAGKPPLPDPPGVVELTADFLVAMFYKGKK